MIWIGWALFAFAVIRLAVSLLNWATRPYLPRSYTRNGAQPEVSVLIPVRNEVNNIGKLLSDLSNDDEVILEILVYDDNSTDNTVGIIGDHLTKNPKIRLIQGKGLPNGWLGKNHACHNLGFEAKGGYLLFLDADVRISGKVVRRGLRYLKDTGVKLLSIFPRQLMPKPQTRLAIPLMNWILLSLLPLIAVKKSSQVSLCAANGQFMFFEASEYHRLQPHSKFRADPVEDLAIASEYKRNKLPIAVLLGRSDIECTMYTKLNEAIEGFSKNFFQFFGGSQILCYLFTLSTTVAPFIIFIFNGLVPGLIYIAVIIAVRLFVSLASRQSVFYNVLLMIPQHVVLWQIIINASMQKNKKHLLWKGRNIYSRS